MVSFSRPQTRPSDLFRQRTLTLSHKYRMLRQKQLVEVIFWSLIIILHSYIARGYKVREELNWKFLSSNDATECKDFLT